MNNLQLHLRENLARQAFRLKLKRAKHMMRLDQVHRTNDYGRADMMEALLDFVGGCRIFRCYNLPGNFTKTTLVCGINSFSYL